MVEQAPGQGSGVGHAKGGEKSAANHSARDLGLELG